MSTLLELAERCEKSIGPDRELDALIMATLFRRERRQIGTQEEMPDGSWRHIKTGVWVDPATDRWVSTAAKEFTGSIDAAMSLLAPGGEINISNLYGVARVSYPLNGGDVTPFYGEHAGGALPLAICAAALRDKAHSLTSQEQNRG